MSLIPHGVIILVGEKPFFLKEPAMTRAEKRISGLYAIMDTSYVDLEEIEATARVIMEAGADIIQLRAKGAASGDLLEGARRLRRLSRRYGAIFIVNDRVDVALLVDADGVHLGQEDIPVEEARKLLGRDGLIGLSTHDPDEVAKAGRLAEKGIIDYISFGPIFHTRTKKDARPAAGIQGLVEARRNATVPITAIGGITAENVPSVLEAGADAVAMISEVLLAKDMRSKIKELLYIIESRNRGG